MGIDFLRRRDPTKPFFLFLSFHRPHPPLDPPQVYFDQYLHQQLPPVPMGDWADQQAQEKGIDGSTGSASWASGSCTGRGRRTTRRSRTSTTRSAG